MPDLLFPTKLSASAWKASFLLVKSLWMPLMANLRNSSFYTASQQQYETRDKHYRRRRVSLAIGMCQRLRRSLQSASGRCLLAEKQ